MTTVAVTGASGKVGRHVVRDLHEHGYRVVALDGVPDESSPAEAWSAWSSPIATSFPGTRLNERIVRIS